MEGSRVTQPDTKPGIYLHPEKRRALRASTPFAAPTQPGWVFLSDDTMIGMVTVRELAAQRSLVENPSEIEWTGRADI